MSAKQMGKHLYNIYFSNWMLVLYEYAYMAVHSVVRDILSQNAFGEFCMRFARNVILWAFYEKTIQLAFGYRFVYEGDPLCRRRSNWSPTLVSATHCVLEIAMCSAVLAGIADYSDILPLAYSYFAYDMRNHSLFSMFGLHHIFTVCAIHFMISDNIDLMPAVFGFLMLEISNLPIYVVHAMVAHPDKYWKERYFGAVLLWEFVWYYWFRIVMIFVVMLFGKSESGHIFAVLFQLMSFGWLAKLARQVQREFGGKQM